MQKNFQPEDIMKRLLEQSHSDVENVIKEHLNKRPRYHKRIPEKIYIKWCNMIVRIQPLKIELKWDDYEISQKQYISIWKFKILNLINNLWKNL